MHRLVKPSDYVLQTVMDKAVYILPWERRHCPGNPTDEPEKGALLYNKYIRNFVHGLTQRTPGERLNEIAQSCLTLTGEPAKALADDLSAAYLGRYSFALADISKYDADSKEFRGELAICSDEIKKLPANIVMALRARAAGLLLR
ncbi:hypothetical protein IMF27_21920 [Pseudomonas sp. PCH199]|uniref:hypothetical protein n=1 Tax=unclassified Pseudomonas TaxID=196821 RepID=UPI000BCCFB6B|nr:MULTISPECIES: hypothetical protein [unclassified Pseudomonas]MCW8277904.1 hypothetical protein [Pseudomonas sp. PCH199]PAM81833.1 hypothetical protein CES87_22370 [Pseudomonas sp. ERMR1:02]